MIPAPDLPIPTSFTADGLVKGWSYNKHLRIVTKSCSTSVSHSLRGWDKTTSRDPIAQYSTELLALQALRAAVAEDHAQQMAAIDEAISLCGRTPNSVNAADGGR